MHRVQTHAMQRTSALKPTAESSAWLLHTSRIEPVAGLLSLFPCLPSGLCALRSEGTARLCGTDYPWYHRSGPSAIACSTLDPPLLPQNWQSLPRPRHCRANRTKCWSEPSLLLARVEDASIILEVPWYHRDLPSFLAPFVLRHGRAGGPHPGWHDLTRIPTHSYVGWGQSWLRSSSAGAIGGHRGYAFGSWRVLVWVRTGSTRIFRRTGRPARLSQRADRRLAPGARRILSPAASPSCTRGILAR
jgi:hypothetical protein